MNRLTISLTGGILALAMVAGVQVVLAQGNSSAITIAVVDAQFILQNSDAGKSASSQIDKVRSDYQQKVKNEQEDINKLNQRIAAERSTLSQDEYQQRMQELQQKTTNYQRDVQDRQQKLNGALRDVSQKMSAAILQIVDEIKKERKLTLVLNRSAVVGTADVPDMTQEVLKRLNQRMPSMTVDLAQ